MKFVHIADMHFGNSFSSLQNNNLAQERKLAQRNAFVKIIDYIKNNKIEHFFISGDFFEQNLITTSIIEYCNKKFREIIPTHIWISPGNHDPYVKNSYYQTMQWAENVTIFKNEVECYQTTEINFYGFGFGSFYEKPSNIENVIIKNKEKINILITHGDLDGNKNIEKVFNPISFKALSQTGFDYVALGHIHKTNFDKNSRINYAGSTICLGFDEIGTEHGFISGEITKEKYNIEFIPLDNNFYNILKLDISEIVDKEELIQEINKLDVNSNCVYQLELIGNRKFIINLNNILKFINSNIIKVKDETNYINDLEELSKENNLKGYFIKEMLDRISQVSDEEKEELEKALEIGLKVLE